MRLIRAMIVKGLNVPICIQVFILSLNEKGIDKYQIVTHVRDWLDCTNYEAYRVVESVLGVCINE